MLKSTILLLVLCAHIAFGAYTMKVKNSAGKQVDLVIQSGKRVCVCLKNTQTKSLRGSSAGDVKLFWSDDCKGNYNTMGSNGFTDNAFWVNSMSYGRSGIASEPPRWCPNYFTLNTLASGLSNPQVRSVRTESD